MTNLEKEGWKKVGGMSDHNWERTEPITGVFVELKENVGPNHSMLYVLKDDKGETWSVWGSTVIDSRFKSIQIGEEVMIEPLGEEEGKNGKKYNNYEVYSRPAPFKKVEAIEIGDDEEPPRIDENS
jgi:hypothetical protein